ncbi:unnamed protein product [Closterium sp. NIES-53]
MARHGTARHGLAWHGMAWHGTARHGMARHGMAWHGMAWHGMARHGPARPGTARHGMAWHGTAWHGMARHGMARHCMTWRDVPCRAAIMEGPCIHGPTHTQACGVPVQTLGPCLPASDPGHASPAEVQRRLCDHRFALLFEELAPLHVMSPHFWAALACGTVPVVVAKGSIALFSPADNAFLQVLPSSFLNLKSQQCLIPSCTCLNFLPSLSPSLLRTPGQVGRGDEVRQVGEWAGYLQQSQRAYSDMTRWKADVPSDAFLALLDLSIVPPHCRLCIHLATKVCPSPPRCVPRHQGVSLATKVCPSPPRCVLPSPPRCVPRHQGVSLATKVCPSLATKVCPSLATKVCPSLATKVCPSLATKVCPSLATKVCPSLATHCAAPRCKLRPHALCLSFSARHPSLGFFPCRSAVFPVALLSSLSLCCLPCRSAVFPVALLLDFPPFFTPLIPATPPLQVFRAHHGTPHAGHLPPLPPHGFPPFLPHSLHPPTPATPPHRSSELTMAHLVPPLPPHGSPPFTRPLLPHPSPTLPPPATPVHRSSELTMAHLVRAIYRLYHRLDYRPLWHGHRPDALAAGGAAAVRVLRVYPVESSQEMVLHGSGAFRRDRQLQDFVEATPCPRLEVILV